MLLLLPFLSSFIPYVYPISPHHQIGENPYGYFYPPPELLF
jgi:hypothetical protein